MIPDEPAPQWTKWPGYFTELCDAGRLQIVWLEQSSQYCATLPELGVTARAACPRLLVKTIAPHIDRLPQAPKMKRVNGHPWPEQLPAWKHLLPRR